MQSVGIGYGKLSRYVPGGYLRHRHHTVFNRPACRTNMPMFISVGRVIMLMNDIASDIDIFCISELAFKRQALYWCYK